MGQQPSCVRCVYPSKFAIDTNLYNRQCVVPYPSRVVYILQNLLLILTYTTMAGLRRVSNALCISFKICY